MFRFGHRTVLAALACVTAAWLGPTRADAQPDRPPVATGVPVLRPDTPPGPDKPAAADGKKLLSINFDSKPWTDVVDWFGRESGLVWVGSVKVPGSFTVKAAPGQQFTIPQIVDLMNEQLLIKKFLLVRRGMSFTILPADEKIDPTMIPRIEVADLPDRGRTEIVQVVAPLQTLALQESVTELEKMLSPFGTIVPLPTANHILLQDTAGSVERILGLIRIGGGENAGTDTLNYECKFVRAAQAADTLRGLLGDDKTTVTGGPQDTTPVDPRSQGYDPRYDPRDRRYSLPETKPYTVNVSADARTNAVLVTGPAVKVGLAKKLLADIDVGKDGQLPILLGPPELRTYSVAVGTAETVAKTLQEAYQTISPSVRVMAIPNSSQVMVYASPGEHMDIVRQINGGNPEADAPTTRTDVIPLNVLDPTATAALLAKIYPPSETNMVIEAQTSGPVVGLFVKGSPAQIADLKQTIADLGDSGTVGGGASGTQVIPVTSGNAAVLAEGLAEMMKKMGKAPVRVVAPGGLPYEPKPATPAAEPLPRKPLQRVPVPGGDSSNSRPGLPVTQHVSAQLAEPETPGEGDPITITVAGDRLIVSGGTPESRALLAQMARLYTQAPKGDDQFEIIRLRNTSAVEAAKVISEVFNGPPPPAQSQQGGRGGSSRGGSGRGGGDSGSGGGIPGFGGGGFGEMIGRFFGGTAGDGATLPTGATPGRVRVVAEPSSNSLIVVKASPLDLFMIRKLLENAIEASPEGVNVVQRTFVIGPLKHANATEVAATIETVYANAIGLSPEDQARYARYTGGSTESTGPGLTVGVDSRSNSLIVMCSEPMFEDIAQLVEHLDGAAKDNTQVVKFIPVKGIDPALVQQALDAIQGRQTQPTQPALSGFGSRGSSRGGFGSPGFGSPGFGSPGFGGFGGSGSGVPGFGGSSSGGGGRDRGSGGGRGGRGGTQRSSRDVSQEDPRNFDDRGMDAPSAAEITQAVLYDPLEDTRPTGPFLQYTPADVSELEVRPVQATQPAPPGGPTAAPQATDVQSPRGTVTAFPLTELGGVIVRAEDQRDLELVIELIRILSEKAKGAEPVLKIVPLKYADPGSITVKLNTVFARVQVGVNGNVVPLAARDPSNALVPGLSATTVQNVFILPLPRFQSLLVIAPDARFGDVLKEIERFDQPNSDQNKPFAFQLKHASAQIVAQQVQQFWNQRYPDEPLSSNQLRVTFDLSSNTVFVQASPADLQDIRDLIEVLDNATSKSVMDVRVFRLRNALAEELAAVIIQSLTTNVVNPVAQGNQGGVQSGGGAFGGGATGLLTGGGGIGGLTGTSALGGGQAGGPGGGLGGGGLGGGLAGGNLGGGRTGGLGGGGLGGGFGGTTGGANLNASVTSVGGTAGGGVVTKTSTLRFFSNRDGQVVETGFLEDVHIIPNSRINALVVTAPTDTMRLIEKMIENLDVVAAAQSFVNVFTLKTADATQTAILLQQLFTGQSGATGAAGGGAGGLNTFAQSGAGSVRPLLTLTGAPADGASLIDLRISVDDRTNSILVAGSQNDLDTIRAVIAKLEAVDVDQRYNEVYKLRNAAAADVALSLQNFISQSLTVLSGSQFLTAYQQLQRNVVVVAEPVSNTLLISATPRYFAEIRRLIEKIDAQPPQVVIQVLIAEVQLSNTQEFGVEAGVQSPILFTRSLLPTPATIANADGSVTGQVGSPGFNFNTTSPLPNANIANSATVGFQGINNLGLGRSSNLVGVGGFVFSAAADSFNLLIRALKQQGRIEVLSRPQIQVADNQTGFVQVGQDFPTLGESTLAGVGLAQQSIIYRPIGITLKVTPRVSPDGMVLMRVEPQISTPTPVPVTLGPGFTAPAFNVQTVQTTVSAADGETIVLGGLITKTDSRTETGIPFLKDIPYAGALFRVRQQQIQKRELLVIMTPHVIRCDVDAARILAEESRRISWVLGDVADIHGHGMEVLGPASRGAMPVPLPPGPPHADMPLPSAAVSPSYPTAPASPTLPGDGLPYPAPATPPSLTVPPLSVPVPQPPPTPPAVQGRAMPATTANTAQWPIAQPSAVGPPAPSTR